MFLANYSDGLTDLPLPAHLEHFQAHDAVASFVSVKPNLSYHVVSMRATAGASPAIEEMRRTPIRINGGFFVFRNEIFDYMNDGEELVVEPFQRLVAARRLAAYDTMASGCRWTPSRTGSSSRTSTPAATRRGRCGTANGDAPLTAYA